MLCFIDSANLDAIRECVEYYPVDGVTTNPTIISREKTAFTPLLRSIREIIGNERLLHVQVTAAEAAGMISEAREICETFGGNISIKIPICREGLKATAALKKEGIKVTTTAVFTPQQALIAAKAGASYVAPFVNRLDSVVGDGARIVAETVGLIEKYGFDCTTIAASFKNVEQVHRITLAGCPAMTLAPELYKAIVEHPMTDCALDIFRSQWKGLYGDATVPELIEKNM